MAYIQPALDFFTHEGTYERGGCERCMCATSHGTRCRRLTCQHRRCCWQHSRTNDNALYDSLTSYSQASPDERDVANKAFHQLRYDSLMEKKRHLRESGAANTRQANLINRLEAAYRQAHADRNVHLRLQVEGFDNPPLRVPPDASNDPALRQRLVRYWAYHANAPHDGFQNEFVEMTTAELQSVVCLDGDPFLAYSASDKPDLIRHWKMRLDAHSPVVHPIKTYKELTAQELNHIMEVAHRTTPLLPRPFRPRPPDYPDGATFVAPTVTYSVPGMPAGVVVRFYRLQIQDAHGRVIDLGLVPQNRDPTDHYTDGSVVVSNIGRLWRNHRLVREPATGFTNGFVGVGANGLQLRVHLHKQLDYWRTATYPYVDIARLRLMADEIRTACTGLAP